ncbi:hypothetical protein H4CHR_03779 [Variovorax sp. PBS-H4]|uniref:hypothetical protein n=1 Tax=Variovorax sp. PBS-H4 TaxID=434008 RepID=UPI0013186525|nr:hypothetical protein [Variovorax sp. PBS-H4]VTU35910.1 hypothetical protein H4CHR_03779 [Variovorax sp. PBS-H4]
MSTNPSRATPNEEPEIGFEESVPLDGPDPVGEKMIEDLGRGKRAEQEPPAPPSEPMPKQFPAS